MDKYTKKEAMKLGKRNIRYNTLYMIGLEETADIFWDSWHLQYKPENKFFRTIKDR
ncbi:hypothetical protein LCGC14_1618900 [marine sediment metagenome]|uniref:Uncharacterized protein n=1 Tax=marine sediment metagenome TaxID=412755 RepID=A0A0F9KLQ1_9ZZZZ